MNKIIKVSTMLGLCFVLACNSGLSPAEYNAYITNAANGLVPEKQVDHLNFRCEYKPAEFMVLNEKSKSLTREQTNGNNKELIAEAQNFITFYLKISSSKNTDFMKAGLKEQNDYYKRLNYYNAEVNKDLWLVHGQDTLNCYYTYLERNYGIGNESTLIVGFQKDTVPLTQDLHLLFNEQAFQAGLLQFDYTQANINKIPKVKL